MARIARCADVVLPELELPLELEPDPLMFGQLGFVLDPPEGGVCVVPPPDGVRCCRRWLVWWLLGRCCQRSEWRIERRRPGR